MKLELGKLLDSKEALRVLGNTRGFKSVVAYRVSKNIKGINKELKAYEEARVKLVEEHCKKDDEGKARIKENGSYDVIEGHMDIINIELEELRKEEVEIEVRKVTLDDIEKAELTPFEIEALEFMIDFEEDVAD